MRKLALVLCAPVLLLTTAASAHFALDMPPSSKGDASGKGAPPCGPDTTDGTATPVTGGGMLPLSIRETVRHGGFYRIALALKNCKTGADCFPADNKVYDSQNKLLSPDGPGTSDHADYDMNPKFPILADNLFPHPQDGQPAMPTWEGMVAIPNVNCDRCTLQVIEFMAPHGPNVGGGYFYHHCADLKITADAGKPIFDPNNPGGGGTGGTGGGGAAGVAGAGGTATAGASAGGSGGSGVTTGGGGSGGTSAPTGGGGTATTTAGTGTTTAGTAAGGTGTSGTGTSGDDGGCGIARSTQGGASALAALGLLLGLVRRRRSR